MVTATTPHDDAGATRAVLDTNVWVDILIFDDPHARPIRAALEHGRLVAPIDACCLAELTLVLDYPQFARFVPERAGALATVTRLARFTVADASGSGRLPQCSDRDDQKFLELAQASGAHWLVSKDRALLKLARRVERDCGFRIAAPQRFTAACGLVEPAAAEPASDPGPSAARSGACG